MSFRHAISTLSLVALSCAGFVAVFVDATEANDHDDDAFDECRGVFAAQFPPAVLEDSIPVCHDGFYATLFNPALKSPYYAAYRADYPGAGKKRVPRQSTAWTKDPQIEPDVQNPPKDPGWSMGYDKGHLAPSHALSLTNAMQASTFVMSNAMPQVAGFNRGAWQQREKQIVKRVDATKQSLYVVTGVHYLNENKVETIGDAPLSVPDYYYSAVCDGHESLAYKGRNLAGSDGKVSAETLKDMATLISVHDLETFVGFELLSSECKKNAIASWPEFTGGVGDMFFVQPAPEVYPSDVAPTPKKPSDQSMEKCMASFAFGFIPKSAATTSVKLCRGGYFATEFDIATKTPLWSAYRYVKGNRVTRSKRARFYFDPYLDRQQQNDPRDKGWGNTWNRGHVCPSNAMSRSQEMQQSTFVVTNVAPQYGPFNQRSWMMREHQIGAWVNASGRDLYVVSGTSFDPQSNKHRLTLDMPIPDYYFTVVCDPATNSSVGWFGENSEAAGAFPKDMLRLRSASYIERLSGLTLLPDDCNKNAKVDMKKWKLFELSASDDDESRDEL